MNTRSVFALLLVSAATSVVACSQPYIEDEPEGLTTGAITASGGTTNIVFLGSAQFLTQCAGRSHTLGCGDPVSSVSDTTPYFSAPRAWASETCRQWYTFQLDGRCVEAQRLEISDTHAQIEGNPGLFDALGLSHSDGTHCAGSGGASGVRITPGRHCDGSDVASSAANSNGSKSGTNDSSSDSTSSGKGTATDDNGKGNGNDDGNGGGKGTGNDDGSGGGGKGSGDDGNGK